VRITSCGYVDTDATTLADAAAPRYSCGDSSSSPLCAEQSVRAQAHHTSARRGRIQKRLPSNTPISENAGTLKWRSTPNTRGIKNGLATESGAHALKNDFLEAFVQDKVHRVLRNAPVGRHDAAEKAPEALVPQNYLHRLTTHPSASDHRPHPRGPQVATAVSRWRSRGEGPTWKELR